MAQAKYRVSPCYSTDGGGTRQRVLWWAIADGFIVFKSTSQEKINAFFSTRYPGEPVSWPDIAGVEEELHKRRKWGRLYFPPLPR